MTRDKLRALFLPALLVSACHRADVAAPTSSVRAEQNVSSPVRSPTEDPSRGDGPQAPAIVRLVLIEQSASWVRLRAEVRKQAPLAVPLAVQVLTPGGVRLEEGPSSWEVPADAQVGTYGQELAFRIEAAPGEPIRLTAHAEGAGFGVHATDAFRVSGDAKSGSRESEEGGPRPQPTGPALKVGDTDFGSTVPNH